MKRSSTQTLRIMYPLKFLCKQYTNQSLSESLLEGISSFCPCYHTALSRLFQVGPHGNPIRGDTNRPAAILLWSLYPPSSAAWPRWSLAFEKVPQGRAATSLLCVLLHLSPHPISIQEATSDPPPPPSPTHPLPTLHTVPSHDRNKWQHDQPQVYWYVYKADLRSHKIKMGEGPGEKGCKVSRKSLCNPEDGWHWARSSRFHGQRGHSHLQFLDCGGPVNPVCEKEPQRTRWAKPVPG